MIEVMVIMTGVLALAGLAWLARDGLRGAKSRGADPADVRDTAFDYHALVCVSARDGRISYVNDNFCRVIGSRREEILGRNVREFRAAINPAQLMAQVDSAMTEGRIWQGDLCIRSGSGGLHWAHTTVAPLGSADGGADEIISVGTDVTELKLAEDSLRHQAERAMEALRAKSEFLAHMSHEIRTPINVVLGMTELALDSTDPEEQHHYIRTVQSSADALLSIVNGVLDYSKIEAGKLELERIPFSIRGMLSDALKSLAPQTHKKGLELILEVSPRVPEMLVGDPGRLRQVILNLVGNAIKFTHKGEIGVHVSCDGQQGRIFKLRFAVTDTGVGIAPGKQQAIFEAFTQEQASTTRQFGGTGLGLTISSSLVRMMGGGISVESAPGKGSTFSFGVNLDIDDAPHLAPAPLSALEGKRVLVVDDSYGNRQVLVRMLSEWKMNVTEADSGAQALQQIDASPVDLVLLDSLMPDRSGFDVAAQILELPAAPRIAVLSSVGAIGDAARCRELGIHAYLPKPVARDDMFGMLRRVLCATPDANATLVTRHSLRESRLPLDLLLVEDNELSQFMMARLLERWGHQIAFAADGERALELMGERHFDAIFLDLRLPGMSGLDVARQWRGQESGRRLPIVGMSASNDDADRDASLAAGMDDFIGKPMDRDGLAALLDRLVVASDYDENPLHTFV